MNKKNKTRKLNHYIIATRFILLYFSSIINKKNKIFIKIINKYIWKYYKNEKKNKYKYIILSSLLQTRKNSQ